MPHAYASTADLVAALPTETAGLSTSRLLNMLIDASRRIDLALDSEGRRTFRTHTATQYLTPTSDRLVIPDLLTLTSLKQDTDGDRTYETTWASTDYDLLPFNAVVNEEPYTGIAPSVAGDYSFWSGPRPYQRLWPAGRLRAFAAPGKSVEIVGKWGYWERTEDTTATTSEAIDLTETVIDISLYSLLSPGQTLLIDTEQMFLQVTTDAATDTMTVDRAVNGTTAATHNTSAPIYRYVYPEAARTATIELVRAGFDAADSGASGPIKSEKIGDIQVTYQDRSADSSVVNSILQATGLAAYRRMGSLFS